MKILLFGATGMVGKGVLLEALDDPDVTEVVSVSRRPLDVKHGKLREVLHKDFTAFDGADFQGVDACFFCLGVSSLGMNEAEYTRVSHDFALAAARRVKQQSPDAVFVYVSGEGTDAASKTMWARVKGQTEDEIFRLFGPRGVAFRPGYIRPERGVGPQTRVYRVLYSVLRPVEPLLKLLAKNQMTTSTQVGRAMLQVARAKQAPSQRMHTRDINALASSLSA